MPFEELYKENYNIVFGFLFNLCKNESLSEELTAETFYKALKNYKSFDGKGRVSSWLCEIAKNEYYKHYNKNNKNHPLDEADDLRDAEMIEEIVQDKQTALRIHKLLHKLEEPYKEVFILRVFAELSFRDIAAILEKNENWARVTYYRAKIKLTEAYNGKGL